MTSTRSTQAGTEPRSNRRVLGISVRGFRLRTRKLLLGVLGLSPVPPLWTRLAGARDLILCLHNVVERHGPLGTNRGLDLTLRELETVIQFLRAEGYRPATLDEVVQRLEPGSDAGDCRFAITFDDGYAGNFHVAHPLLRRHNIPFTVYVTTGFMDRTVCVWWYALERLLVAVDRVAFEHAGRAHVFAASTLAQKVHADHAIRALLQASPSSADDLLEQLFRGRVPDLGLGASDVLTPEQVGALSHDPLVTIGGHSISHPVLRELATEDSRREISACRERLEAVTGRSVRHFAYPFGNRAAFGPREEQFVRETGYETATTTRARRLTPADRHTALPRIMLTAELNVIAALRSLMTGWFGHGD
jgi:peptidoglycan/xylan/chitin deacetylase (PgdA/CDA1 family)